MIKVAITGGIGSGKTTICNIWQSLGAYILNADDLARKIMIENGGVKEQIKATFGEEAYLPDGSLNRGYLAEQAFGKDRVGELNRIVHPHIPVRAEKIMGQAGREGYPVFVYEAALLLQNLRPDDLDYIVIVLADREKRLRRVLHRDHMDRQKILERMKAQQDFEALTDRADFVIRNNGTPAELEERVREIFHLF